MKTFILLAFATILLFSCKKETAPSNQNTNVVDTSAVGKFVTAAAITNAQLKVNLDSLVARAKRHGWWELCNAIYPFAGGTAASCKYNLKDPRDADNAFRL